MRLGQRIMIIGCGGAGKSTLARQLGELLRLPVIHLDTIYWQAGWVKTPEEEWEPKVREIVQGERWIVDGNYSETIPIRLAAADTVIFLEYSRWLCLWRVIKRLVWNRGRARADASHCCIERLNLKFVKWILNFPRHSRPRILHLLAEHGAGTHIIAHRSPSETRRMVEGLKEIFRQD